jgi:hypothetical protein
MDWSNERYVRVYTRDTVTWKLWSWESRALWLFLLRKVDRAGVLDLDGSGSRGVAAIVEMPLEMVEIGLDGLIASRAVEWLDVCLVIPNFIEAQECTQTDAHRQRERRARRRELARAQNNVGTVSLTTDHRLPPNGFRSQPTDTVTRTTGLVTPDRTVPDRTVPSQPDAVASDARALANPTPSTAKSNDNPDPTTAIVTSNGDSNATRVLRLWALQEQLIGEARGIERRDPMPGELNRPLGLLESGWTEEQISQCLRALAARAVTSKQEAGYLNRDLNWREKVLLRGESKATGDPFGDKQASGDAGMSAEQILEFAKYAKERGQ